MTLEQLFNQAIQLCGSETVIITVNDVNKEARLCRDTYDLARRAVLQKHPWKFSIKRVLLDVDATETPAFGYTAQYLLPSDYIRVVTLNQDWSGPWTQEGGYLLYSGGGQIQLRYVYDIQDLEKFPPLFVDSVIAELAARIAYPLTQSNERGGVINDAARYAIKMAKRADAIEQSPKTLDANEWSDARLVRQATGHYVQP